MVDLTDSEMRICIEARGNIVNKKVDITGFNIDQ